MQKDNRKDWYEILDENIKRNSGCVAVVVMKQGVIKTGNGNSLLKTCKYGPLFNLCECERFREQPVTIVPHFTGFLVKDDVIAVAGHSVNHRSVTSIRVIFGYKMITSSVSLVELPDESIYKGKELISSHYVGNGADWALIKLDRKVKDQAIAVLSRNENSFGHSVYAIGHPVGLPQKYSGKARVIKICLRTYFTATLNIYSGDSGSPVFNSDTHEVIGIVSRGYDQYFKFLGNCWTSIKPSDRSPQEGAHCTRVSEFIEIVETL